MRPKTSGAGLVCRTVAAAGDLTSKQSVVDEVIEQWSDRFRASVRAQKDRGKKDKGSSASTRSVSMALRYCQGITLFYLHTLHFIRKRNELYLPLPSQPQLVLIYRSRRDGRLSRSWCEVAHAKIRTCNLPIANPALYHTATSAPLSSSLWTLYVILFKKCSLSQNDECYGNAWKR